MFSKLLMNANIMNEEIFQITKYDINGHGRSHKTLIAKFFIAHSFINRF